MREWRQEQIRIAFSNAHMLESTYSVTVAEWSKVVLRLRISANLILVYFWKVPGASRFGDPSPVFIYLFNIFKVKTSFYLFF